MAGVARSGSATIVGLQLRDTWRERSRKVRVYLNALLATVALKRSFSVDKDSVGVTFDVEFQQRIRGRVKQQIPQVKYRENLCPPTTNVLCLRAISFRSNSKREMLDDVNLPNVVSDSTVALKNRFSVSNFSKHHQTTLTIGCHATIDN